MPDKEKWYIQTGQGMIATLNVATEKGAYTMTDRGTFIKYTHNHGGKPPLVALVEGDPGLFNQYSNHCRQSGPLQKCQIRVG